MKSTASNKTSAAAARRQFMRLAARGYRRIPVMRSLFADLDTPVSTYLKVGNLPYTYLLESVQGGDKWGRYSFIGLPSQRVLRVHKHQVTELSFGGGTGGVTGEGGATGGGKRGEENYVHKNVGVGGKRGAGGTGDTVGEDVSGGTSNCGGKSRTFDVADPLDYIREQSRRFAIPSELLELPQLQGLPRFCGGLVGYFAYECAAYAEPRLRHLLDKDAGVGCPQIVLMHSNDIIAFDNLLGKMVLISYADLDGAGADSGDAGANGNSGGVNTGGAKNSGGAAAGGADNDSGAGAAGNSGGAAAGGTKNAGGRGMNSAGGKGAGDNSDGGADLDAALAAAAFAKAQTRLDEMERLLASPLPAALAEPLAARGNDDDEKLRRLLSAEAKGQGDKYRAMVRRVKEYVRAGDAMQVVPSQRMEIDYGGDGFDFYRALRTVNPAPYMFYLHLDDFVVAGASPEILSRLEYTHRGGDSGGDAVGGSAAGASGGDGGGESVSAEHKDAGDGMAAGGGRHLKRVATIRPIAGTRPRGKDKRQDEMLAQEMLNDPKEIAEHLMLIDLGRNDLGKVSKTGSIVVDDTFGVEKYSHVMHIVSNVTGELKDELDALDLLKSSLPAGTLSGAPKIRAMEIIAELEGSQRGIYGGALGYLGWQGNMDMCIGIRTAVIKHGKLFLQAGGGIVADSDEDLEWNETLNKRGALLRVANMLGLGGLGDADDA